MTAAGNSSAPLAQILRAFWRSDWISLSLVAAIVFASSVSSIAAPFLFSRAIDRLTKDTLATDLLWALLAYAALLGVSSLLRRVIESLSIVTSQNLAFIASTTFFERILKKQVAFFVEHNPAEIQNATTQGRDALIMFLQVSLMVFIPGVTQIGLTLAMLGYLLNIQIMATVIVYGAIVIGLTVILTRRSQGLFQAAINAHQENARFMGNAMTAMETLRHLGSHDWMSRRFADKARDARNAWRFYVKLRVGISALVSIGLAVQFAINFALLIPQYQAGTISIGDIVLFNALLLQLNQPFEMIAQTLDTFSRARANVKPMVRMWQAPEESETSDARAFVPQDGRISFENVGYRYGNGRGVDDVTFTARRGAITFITGETGAGKSTIFKLALKSIDPQSGRILIDDADLARIARADWYSNIAVVPQDVVLLNESLADNILLGRPRDEARLRAAAQKAAILAFIDAHPEGFETIVGERGLKLSGGERQRIAIARALYGNPTILFLDEASSALDDITERDIMDHVRSLARDVTVLAITHRTSVLTDADQVVRLTV